MKILTHGRKPEPMERIRKGVCPACGCEFSYTIVDAIRIERGVDGRHYVKCPETWCEAEIGMKN